MNFWIVMGCRAGRVVLAAAVLLVGAAGSSATEEDAVDPFDVARDSYSMPAVFHPADFYSLSRLFIQPGSSLFRADNYGIADLERVSEGGREWVRWHFSRATDAFAPSLAYRNQARVAPLRFSIRVWNRGKDEVALSAWGDNAVENRQRLAPGEERLVTLEGQTTLVAQGTKRNAEYDVYLRDLTIFYPEADGLSAAKLTALKTSPTPRFPAHRFARDPTTIFFPTMRTAVGWRPTTASSTRRLSKRSSTSPPSSRMKPSGEASWAPSSVMSSC